MTDVQVKVGSRSRWAPTRRAHDLLFAAGAAVTLWLVLAVHGFWFGEAQPLLPNILDGGFIQCLHNRGVAGLTLGCPTVGEPNGLTALTGAPEILVAYLLSWLPGVDAWAAHQLMSALCDAAALWGGFALLRRWHVPRWFALIASAAYLVSPTIIGINGFDFTFTGLTFLPLYFYLSLRALDAFEATDWVRGTLVMFGVVWVMVFTDGYSYATALVLIAIAGLGWLLRSGIARSTKIRGAVIFALANGSGVLAYRAYINASPAPSVGLGAFRFQGLDPVTLFVTPARLLWPSWIGFHTPVLHLWGDGSNVTHNYIGWVILGLVVFLIASRWLSSAPVRDRAEIFWLGVGAAVTLFLALGPAFKLNSHPIPVSPPSNVPVSATRFGLPTAWLDAHLSPFKEMRATYRWATGFRFFMVFAAAVAVALIWQRGKRAIAVILFVLAVLETAPSPAKEMRANRYQHLALHRVQTQFIPEFDGLTKAHERVLILPSTNDFLANALGPFANVRLYNVGIDKSRTATMAVWPADVRAAVAGQYQSVGYNDRVAQVLHTDADVVVVSYVDLLQGARQFSALNAHVNVLHSLVDQISVDPRFVVTRQPWMVSVRLRPGV